MCASVISVKEENIDYKTNSILQSVICRKMIDTKSNIIPFAINNMLLLCLKVHSIQKQITIVQLSQKGNLFKRI